MCGQGLRRSAEKWNTINSEILLIIVWTLEQNRRARMFPEVTSYVLPLSFKLLGWPHRCGVAG